MNKIQQAFANGKAFIPFVTAGDPDLATTEALIVAMAQAGADIIEIGIPFPTPLQKGRLFKKPMCVLWRQALPPTKFLIW